VLSLRATALAAVLTLIPAAHGQRWPLDISEPPAFSVQFTTTGGSSFQLTYWQPIFYADGTWYYEDLFVSATVESLPQDEWRLTITNINPVFGFHITQVFFPWDIEPFLLNPDLSDDFVLMPFLSGVAFRANLQGEWQWWTSGDDGYPGPEFAPFVIVADRHAARITAATNWPPKSVIPRWSLNRQTLFYANEKISFLQSETYRFRRVVVAGDAAAGDPPWMRAAEQHRDWLTPRMTAAGLLPVKYPAWMRMAHGFLNVQLEDLTKDGWAKQVEVWNKYNKWFPWIQFWGQMSCHWSDRDSDGGFPDCYGCCLLDTALHPRYQVPGFDIPSFAVFQQWKGFHVGYYTRPWPDYLLGEKLPLPTSPTNLAWWTEWLNKTEFQWNANAYFHDTLGSHYFGAPLNVAGLYPKPRFQNAMIEGAVDLYPTAYLVSNALHYPFYEDGHLVGGFLGGPGHTLDDLGKLDPGSPTGTVDMVPFPQLGNFILSDRLFFNGVSNSGGAVWGKAAQYWAERQNFLLGWKFDIQQPFDGWDDPNQDNPAVALTIALRDAAGWWQREPRYLDRRGLSQVPGAVDVRRFVDRNGVDLLVIDNWHQVPGLTFQFLGKSLPVPTSRLTIFDLGLPGCVADLVPDGKVDYQDLGVMLKAYGSCEGDPNWEPAANLYVTSASLQCVDQSDLTIFLAHFGEDCAVQ
jgi:hypothetical protein